MDTTLPAFFLLGVCDGTAMVYRANHLQEIGLTKLHVLEDVLDRDQKELFVHAVFHVVDDQMNPLNIFMRCFATFAKREDVIQGCPSSDVNRPSAVEALALLSVEKIQKEVRFRHRPKMITGDLLQDAGLTTGLTENLVGHDVRGKSTVGTQTLGKTFSPSIFVGHGSKLQTKVTSFFTINRRKPTAGYTKAGLLAFLVLLAILCLHDAETFLAVGMAGQGWFRAVVASVAIFFGLASSDGCFLMPQAETTTRQGRLGTKGTEPLKPSLLALGIYSFTALLDVAAFVGQTVHQSVLHSRTGLGSGV